MFKIKVKTAIKALRSNDQKHSDKDKTPQVNFIMCYSGLAYGVVEDLCQGAALADLIVIMHPWRIKNNVSDKKMTTFFVLTDLKFR